MTERPKMIAVGAKFTESAPRNRSACHHAKLRLDPGWIQCELCGHLWFLAKPPTGAT